MVVIGTESMTFYLFIPFGVVFETGSQVFRACIKLALKLLLIVNS